MATSTVPMIFRKKPEEIAKMHAAGRILAACLTHLGTSVRAGMTTRDLDTMAETFIRDHGCTPGFIGYQGYPDSLCISVNDEVVHGMPGRRGVRARDLVALD